MILDQYGNPIAANDPPEVYGPQRHPIGPMRFEHQPKDIRAGGRKQRYGVSKKAAARAERRAARRSGGGGGGRAGRSSRADYAHYNRTRKATFGPVRMSDQPASVRGGKARSWFDYAKQWLGVSEGGGRKGRKGRKSSRRSSGGGTSRKSLRAAGYTKAQIRAIRRSNSGVWASSRGGGGSRKSRRMSRRGGGGGGVLRLNTLYRELDRQPGLKAWVCVGPTRTGCGGGRKGGRGSRVFGVLRP